MQLALFDFDHTLTDSDTFSRFLRRVATPRQLRQAKWTLGPWLLGYRIRLVSAAGIRERATRVAFSGRNAEEIATLGATYSAEALPALLRPEMRQRLEWHRAQGHDIALVSASLDVYLQPWCARHGVAHLICNRLEADGGTLTGRYADGDIGPHKAREIRARFDLSKYERIHAYGDSAEDRPMLALAHERWYAGKRIA